jgi:hypothetical protein
VSGLLTGEKVSAAAVDEAVPLKDHSHKHGQEGQHGAADTNVSNFTCDSLKLFLKEGGRGGNLGLLGDDSSDGVGTNSKHNGLSESGADQRLGKHGTEGTILEVVCGNWGLLVLVWLSSQLAFNASDILSLNHDAVAWHLHASFELDEVSHHKVCPVDGDGFS